LKEQRNRNETGLKQKYMKLANLRRILGDALLNNFQVKNGGQSEIKFAHHLRGSVADPDPLDQYVFGPAGSGSVNQRYGSGSGSESFYQQERKPWFLLFCFFFFDFLSWKKDVNVPSKSNKFGVLKVNDENKMSWIRRSGSVPKCHGSATLLRGILGGSDKKI
jgi:hypothetical protein